MKKENRSYTELEKSYDAERIDFFNKEFFVCDMKIVFDFSMFFVKKVISMVYSNTFFGNEILITQETYERVRRIANDKSTNSSPGNVRNCQLFLKFMLYDTKQRIQIIKLENQDVVEYVKSNPRMILYVSSTNFYYEAQKRGARVRLYDKHCGVYNERSIKYDTLGMLLFNENNEMYIQEKGTKPGTSKMVYDSDLKEKVGEKIKVNIGDYVVIRKEHLDVITFVIYRVVNYHSKNNSVKLIWTDLKKGETENIYINYPELRTLIVMNL